MAATIRNRFQKLTLMATGPRDQLGKWNMMCALRR